jgi:hypothetical protein
MIGGWIHPWLALGALAAVVPLLIHLLNRQRHRPVQWGAMRFVLAAYERTRRRTRFENLLLLLLRMAAVALLALTLARPFAGEQSPLAPLTESRRDLVLILDASASTGLRLDSGTVFDGIVARARDLVDDLDGGRGDQVRVVLADERPRLLSWRSPSEAAAVLATLGRPSDGAMDLAGALGVALASIEERGEEVVAPELRLLTDMQRGTFVEADGSDRGLTEVLGKLAEVAQELVVEDLSGAGPAPGNVGVTEVRPLGEVLGPGLPVDVAVEVTNHGPEPVAGLRLSLSVDGERQPSRSIDVPAGGRTEQVFTLVLSERGDHLLEAAVEVDRLPFDDGRPHVLRVPGPIRVLMVNGAPDTRAIEADEVGLLAAALSPPDGGLQGSGDQFAPFLVEVVDPAALDDPAFELERNDVVVFANVESPTRAAVARLAEHVAGGAGLILTLGDRVSPALWNERLFSADGSGLLPAELLELVAVGSPRDGYFRVASFDVEHPALWFFADERWQPLLTEVPIHAFVAADPLPDARTLASLDSAESPLLVEREFGAGRVLLWTTSIDRAWSRIPESASTLIPLAHELVRHAGSGPPRPSNLALGAPLAAIVDGFPRGPVLLSPDGTRRSIEGEPLELGGGRWALPPFEDTHRAGVLTLELEGEAALRFVVEPVAAEGRLERITPGELEALHPALRPARDTESGEAAVETAPRGELWRGLAALCLALLIAESAWGAWVGRRRRAA